MQVVREQHDGLRPPRSLLSGPPDRAAQKRPRMRAPEQPSPLIRYQREEEHASFVVATIVRHWSTLRNARERVQQVTRPTPEKTPRRHKRDRIAH